MKEVRVSSSWTLFYKIFFPTGWIVFFGAFAVFLLFDGFGSVYLPMALRIGYIVFFVAGLVTLWFTLMSFKRVEMDEDCFYVTNYFKTYKYSYDSIASINELDFIIMKVVVLRFVERSSFGRKIFFVARRSVWGNFVQSHPHLFAHLAK